MSSRRATNLLAVPFKKTYDIDIKSAVQKYFRVHGPTSSDAYRHDINEWQAIRKDGVGGVIHVNRINAMLIYHAQLTSILTKLPSDIQLKISYAPVFDPDGIPVSLCNLVFEQASVTFNLGALYSQLAFSEDRSHAEGIKRAVNYYQQAAGAFAFLSTSVLPNFSYSPEDERRPLDLTPAFVRGLEWLMLAQAQECYWQRAKLDVSYKNSLIARLAASVTSFYDNAINVIQEATPSVQGEFLSSWLPHFEAKMHHFEAVAQFRKSTDDGTASKYGEEIARLSLAQSEAKKAYDSARRGKVSTAVINDSQSLLDAVQKNLTRAERDNDLIYHQDVPAPSALPQISHASVVQAKIPDALANPSILLKPDDMLFTDMLGWGAQTAIDIYEERRTDHYKTEIEGRQSDMKSLAQETLRSLNLPAVLEALERPIGLPPSLLKKAEEVRLEEGPLRIETSLEDLKRLADQNSKILEEAMDILDHEASEDEACRRDANIARLPSHEANISLISKEQQYRSILEKAAQGDATIQDRWDEWEDDIRVLTREQADLEALVPQSLPSRGNAGLQSLQQSRHLRELLESLDSVHRDVDQTVRTAQTVLVADDISPQIARAATGFAKLGTMKASMFEDILEDSLFKYDPYISDLDELQSKHRGILDDIKVQNAVFLQSRRDDPSVKGREHAFQSLDMSHQKYREILGNLEEGIKFYNELAVLLSQFKEECKNWSYSRQEEMKGLTHSMDAMAISTQKKEENARKTRRSNPKRPAASVKSKEPPAPVKAATPKDFSDWGFQPVPTRPDAFKQNR